MTSVAITPLMVTFYDLATAMRTLHMWDTRYIDTLHDVWKCGAPTPDSIIRNARGYDERVPQRGNVERRIVLPTKLATWIVEMSALRGYPYTFRQALNIATGQADYGYDEARTE